jgi:hypothetical protein
MLRSRDVLLYYVTHFMEKKNRWTENTWELWWFGVDKRFFFVLKLACVTRSCGLYKKPQFFLTKHHVMWQDDSKALILHIKLRVCLFVCLFYLIQIFISETIGAKLCTHFSLSMEETVGYVWSENVWSFLPFWPSSGRVPNPRHEMAAGASQPQQPYIRDSCWC